MDENLLRDLNQNLHELTIEEKLSIVAMKALQQSIANLPAAISVNAAQTQPQSTGQPPPESFRDSYKRESPGVSTGGSGSPFGPPSSREEFAGKGGGSPFGGGKMVGGPPIMMAIAAVADKFSPHHSGSIEDSANPIKMLMLPATTLAAKFNAIIGPAAVMQQILNSNASGFQVLGTAVKVFAASLAPILLPVTTVVAAAFLYLGDIIWGKLLPALGDWDKLIIAVLVPTMKFFVDAIHGTIIALQRFNDRLHGRQSTEESATDISKINVDKIRKAMKEEGKTFDEFAESRFIVGPTKDRLKKAVEGGGPTVSEAEGHGKPGGGALGSFAGSFRDVLKELRLSVGPRAQITGLTDVAKNLQLAAVNASPFETKILDRMDKALTTLERIAAGPGSGPAYGGP